MRIFVFTIVLLATLVAPWAPTGVDAQEPPQAPAVVELRYAGIDPFGGQSAIFVAKLGNNSDDRITGGDLTAELGYRWALANSTDWRCAATPELTSSCTRTLPSIAPHGGLEFPIVMVSAAGVCLSASPNVTFVLEFPSGKTVVSAMASAPSRCPGQNGLPLTGQSAQRATPILRTSLILLISGSILVVGGVRVRSTSTKISGR